MLLGQITNQAQKKTALPFPTAQTANGGLAYTDPISGIPQSVASLPATSVTPPTNPNTQTSPSTVAQALANTTETVNQAKGALNSVDPFLTNLQPTATGVSPFRQSLTNTKASTTADAYDSAISQARNKAASMGFSSNSQPVTFGAETSIGQARAKAIADIPNQVNTEAQPLELEAAQLQQAQAPIYNALANTQAGQTSNLSSTQQQQNQINATAALQQKQIEATQALAAQQQKASLASGLATAAVPIGTTLLQNALKKTVTPAATALAAPAVAGTLAAGGLSTGATATALGAAPSLAALGPEAVGPTAESFVAGTTGVGGGGISGALGALATNPITWAVGGAIAAALIWRSTQVHQTADTFVKGYQDQFANDKGTGHLNEVVDQFDKAYASGQMTKEQAQSAYEQTASLIDKFKQDTNAFSQQGGKESIIAHQAAATMAKNFGANFEKILGKMSDEISRLPGAA